jgi:hypothetical protein
MKKALLLLFSAVFVLFLYTFLHEGGHALAAVLFGGQISAFSVNFLDFSAHVSFQGEFTTAQRAVVSIAGISLPFLVWLGFMLLVPKRANLALDILKALTAMSVLNTFLVWILAPLLNGFGIFPSDDSTNFLQISGAPPLLVAALFLLLYTAGWALFLVKIEGLRPLLARLRATTDDWITPGVTRTLQAMVGIFFLTALSAFALNDFRLSTPSRQTTLAPPDGFNLVRSIDLADQSLTDEPLLNLALEQPQAVGIFLRIRNADSDYIDVRLTGAENYDQVLFHAEGYTAGLDNVTFHEELEPGEYTLLLTSQQSPGAMEVFKQGY